MVWCTHAYSSSYGDEAIGLYELRNLRPSLQDAISKEKIKKGMKERRKEKREGGRGRRRDATSCVSQVTRLYVCKDYHSQVACTLIIPTVTIYV